jgi:hypothetical protein
MKKSFIVTYTMEKNLNIPKWLFIVLIAILIFRIPTFFEPYSYGDETIYLTLGEGMRHGLTLYKDIHDNKPPLLYATAALAGSLFWFKAILCFWMLGTTVLFWKLTENLFPKKKNLQCIATIIFAILTTLPLLEGRTANAELFMLAPTIGAFLFLLTKTHTTRNIFFAGILFAIATLFKVPAAFDMPAIIFLWFVTLKKFDKQNIQPFIRNSLFLILGFITPIALTFVWYYLRGAFHEYLVAAWLQNFGYLSSFRPEDVQKPFLEKNGPLLLRAGIVAFGMLVLFILRNKLSKQFIFICGWLLLSLFAITLSERPYPHYLIQAIPTVSLLLGMLFTLQTLEQSLVIIPLSLFFFVPVYFKFWYYPTLPYYTHFIQLASGQINKEEYLKTFGDGVPDTYAISEFVASSTKPDDPVFVWGSDSSNIYALARRLPPLRYVATYHINDFSSHNEVIEQLMHKPPELVVVLPESESFPELQLFLRDKYGLAETINGTTIWKYLTHK